MNLIFTVEVNRQAESRAFNRLADAQKWCDSMVEGELIWSNISPLDGGQAVGVVEGVESLIEITSHHLTE